MKNLLRVSIAGGLLAGAIAVSIVNASRKELAVIPPQQRSKRMEKLARLQTRDFHGEAGLLRAKQLRKLNKGVARAMKDAKKRGLTEAFEHGRVILATDPEDGKSNPNPSAASGSSSRISMMRPVAYRFSYPQDTFTDGEYEVTFIPYDDGDPNNWEGIVYRYDPDWGEDIRFGVIDISTDEPQVTQEVYYPPDGGDPSDPNGPPLLGANRPSCEAPPNTQNVQYQKVGASTQGRCGHCPPPNRCCLRLSDECCTPPPNLSAWFKCSARGCAGASLGCSRTGPAFGDCWGFACTGAMLTCLF